MKRVFHSPVGLIAGSGGFPLAFVHAAHGMGLQVVVLAHRDQSDPILNDHADICEWFPMGRIGAMIRAFKRHGVRQVAFLGGLSKRIALRSLRPDWRTARMIARIASRNDDSLLRAVISEFERDGFDIFAPSEILPSCLAAQGYLAGRPFSVQELADARMGWRVAKALGELDIGQSVVVARGSVVAVEAVEGTDAMIVRAGELGAAGGVVIKCKKPSQDERVDLPSVGPQTIATMARAGIRGLVIEAHATMVADAQELIESADRAGIAVIAVRSLDDLQDGATA